MPLLRKDIKIGFIAGGGLLALGLGYVLMLSFSGGPDQANAGGQDQPGTPDPLGAPIDAANTDYSEWNDTASSAGNDWDEPFVTTTPNPGDPVPVVPFGDDAGEPATADLNGPSDASFGSAFPTETTTPATPAVTGGTQHTIASGDNFSSLALHYYGDANLFSVIAKANPGVDSGRLKIGQVVTIPDRAAATTIAQTPAPSAAGTHTVSSGENLYTIAEKRLGRSNLWEQIYSLNRDLIGEDPANLKVGMVLKLPG